MSWRTVILAKEAKLTLRMGHLIVSGETVNRVPLEEISFLLIENPNIQLTGHLINALSHHHIVTLICDANMKPSSVVNSVYGHHRQSRIIAQQATWTEERKGMLWQEITKQKIENQRQLLIHLKKEGIDELSMFRDQVEVFDTTNREGHAAKVYFNRLYGQDFTRSIDEPRNWALNYGYVVIHSLIARQIVSRGYLTELGIFHANEFNQMNLASDFVEVFRPLVDYIVHEHITDTFGKDEKRKVLKMLEYKVQIRNSKQFLQAAVQVYLDSCLQYLNDGHKEKLLFPILDFPKAR
ncbi:CRISPR-associated protein Cas1 [Planococcus antarcticus DSM 14505]|uniref:CRISPR-associated endonuclease Cas1 n=1 Tax=Planococcus antarcticus DSM 14505 TaxID=1185653 RepID=A0A1C7DH21_9BACL|nr:type II CRISPR-associated endonuclease Cas1 [Planococcus antarcticus]ANU10859.1 subtype II CRISPR-associated endonuclease Cas1 [Planococcus antarcticus DSM 14505]EIM08309.1 CRISPR-associated protein Cas1 [Planococcus antarcticus DSM 14505]